MHTHLFMNAHLQYSKPLRRLKFGIWQPLLQYKLH